MVSLLAMVAVLQFRWTNQAVNSDETRIRTELDSLMVKWHEDLYSEFSAVCAALQVGPDSGARDTWNDYLERYVEWNNALPHESLPYVYRNPDVVGDVYIWETNVQPVPRLFLLNLNTRKIEPILVPPEFNSLLSRLQKNSDSLSRALNAWQFPEPQGTAGAGSNASSVSVAPGSRSTMGWQFDPDIPAIVHPILRHGIARSLSSSSPVDWIVITLDMNVLRKRVLPELGSKYFGGLEGLNYKIALIKIGPSQETIYTSESGFGIGQLDTADSTLSIFSPSPGTASASRQPLNNVSDRFRNHASQASAGTAWFPIIQYSAIPHSWLLELQYRSMPLQALVNSEKRSNLLLSAVVLLLLALNIAVLTIAGYRAQSFADLQMAFVASVSHELRTPLSVIFSAGENLKDGLVNSGNIAQYGSIVTAQSRQLMNQVDRILLYASIRSGKDRYTLRPLDVSEILSRVHKNLSGLLIEQSCILEQFIQDDLPLVLGDMHAVCGCLENLIANAVKYSTTSRHVLVRAALQVDQRGASKVSIAVTDHGIGIRRSEYEKIFEPFYRSSDYAATQVSGTGLGLALAKHLAEAMGGSLSVESEFRTGSVFTLQLQVAEIKRSQAEEHDHSLV